MQNYNYDPTMQGGQGDQSKVFQLQKWYWKF